MRVYGKLVSPTPEVSAAQVLNMSYPTDVLHQLIETQKEAIEILKNQVEELTTEKRELRAQVMGLLEYRKQASPTHQPIKWLQGLIGITLVFGILALLLWRSH